MTEETSEIPNLVMDSSAPRWPGDPGVVINGPPLQASSIPSYSYKKDNDTLGTRLVDLVAGGVKRLWRSSYTVLTVDLKRASISYDGPHILRRRSHARTGGPTAAMLSYPNSLPNAVYEEGARGRSSAIEATGAQARLKVMQVWDLTSEHGRFNLGVGGVFEMDKGQLRPKLKLQATHASLHLLPEPMLELRRKWPLPPYTRLGLDVRGRIPLTSPDKMWHSGARLMINLFNLGGPGIHFTPGGLLLEENVLELGKYTKMRVAAALEFPRELPWNEAERPFKLEIRRVGIKARTM